MYDTLHLWLNAADAGSLDHLGNIINNVCVHEKDGGREVSITGNYKGLKLAAGSRGISIKGSLCKYYLQNNIYTITRQGAGRAIEMLADELKLPIKKSIVSRIDVAFNLLMDQTPKLYYSLLGICNRYERLEQPCSIYYTNSKRTKLFYDKLVELKKQRLPIPAILEGENILRYEFRLMRRIAEQMNLSAITASILSNEDFYIKILDKWLLEYENIQKQQKQIFDLMNMQVSTPKDFFDQMAWARIIELGETETMGLIDKLKTAGNFEHREYPSRLKRQIKEHLRKINKHNPKDDLLAEMDKKIKKVICHYR